MAITMGRTCFAAFKLPVFSARTREILPDSNGSLSLSGAFKERLAQLCLLTLSMLAAMLSAVYSRAQDNYEIQVYGPWFCSASALLIQSHNQLI